MKSITSLYWFAFLLSLIGASNAKTAVKILNTAENSKSNEDAPFDKDSIYRSSAAIGGLVSEPPEFNGQSIYDLFAHGIYRSGTSGGSFGVYYGGRYEWISYRDVDEQSRLFGNGLSNLQLYGPVDSVGGVRWRMLGIYSEHRLAWTLTELASARQNITLVPIYDTANPNFVSSILHQTRVETVVVSDKKAGDLLRLLQRQASEESLIVKVVILIGTSSDRESLLKSFPNIRVSIMLMSEVKYMGEKGSDHIPSRQDVNTVCFTSGTTGEPKGALITHGMLIAVVASAASSSIGVSRTDKYFAFLPPAHILERVVGLTVMFSGAKMGYYSGSKKDLARDMRLVAPTLIAGVPRFLEKLVEKIEQQLGESGNLASALSARALRASDKLMNGINPKYRARTLSFINRVPIAKIRKALGGKLRLILSGGGPLNPTTQKKLKTMLHVYVVQGYGLTETTGGTLLQSPTSLSTGVVGIPLPCVEVKLANRELYGNGEGELFARGPSVFKGYFGQAEFDPEIFTEDGWFKTGDIARVTKDGEGKYQFEIVGRRKEIFKLPNGEYAVPALLEGTFRMSNAVEEIFVDIYKGKLFGIVNLKPQYLSEYVQRYNQRKPATDQVTAEGLTERFLNSKEFGIVDLVLKNLNIVAESTGISERLGDIHLTLTPIGMETEFQTATMKPKRQILRDYFDLVIQSL